MNLLNVGFAHKIFKSRWFPIVPQLIMLIAFFLLIAGGFGIGVEQDDLTVKENMDFMKQLRNTNASNLVVWSYWWPLVIISAILLGRVWCTVCPMELITSFASKFGLKRRVPKFLKSGWGITLTYTFILVLAVHTWSIHRIPHRMALYLLALLAIPLLMGLIFEKRAFCNYICPVGHMLGIYARIAPLEWRSKDLAVCKACTSKDCIAKANHYKLIGRSCTSNLYPATIEDNQECLVCTQCYKVCPSDNLKFSTRKFLADFFVSFNISISQLAFIILLSGFVAYEVLTEWNIKGGPIDSSKEALKFLPDKVTEFFHLGGTLWAPFAEAILLFIVLPLIFFAVVTLLTKISTKMSVINIAIVFAMLLIPIMAATHLTKSTLKMTSRIPYWEHTVSDQVGVDTAAQIHGKSLKLDKSIPGAMEPLTTTIAVVVYLLALFGSLMILFRSSALKELKLASKIPLLLGVLAYWSMFAAEIYFWRIAG